MPGTRQISDAFGWREGAITSRIVLFRYGASCVGSVTMTTWWRSRSAKNDDVPFQPVLYRENSRLFVGDMDGKDEDGRKQDHTRQPECCPNGVHLPALNR